MTLGQFLVLTFLAGALRGVEHAARQSYAHDVVGAARSSTARILGLAMRAGWLLGSLGVGAVIAHRGSGEAYLAVASPTCWAACPAPGPRARRGAAARPTRSGAASPASSTAVREDRMLLVLMMLTAGAEVLGFAHQALLPSLSATCSTPAPRGSAR